MVAVPRDPLDQDTHLEFLVRRIKRLGLLIVAGFVVWGIGSFMTAFPLLGLLVGWLVVAYVVSRAWPAMRRDLDSLRLRTRLVMLEAQTGDLA